jgi:pimeloyl-ACP methyl ester carboxylesterase
MSDVTRPRLEGTVAVRDGRRLGFASFGHPHGRPIIWMHGTPGARRQIPLVAREVADRDGLRIIGIDRPGIGSSTPHVYPDVLDWTQDLELFVDALGIDRFEVIGLSGGGPYTLAAGAALSHRVDRVAVIGGVAPVVGPDAVGGGVVGVVRHAAPVVRRARVPLGLALTAMLRLSRPVAGPVLDLYRLAQPDGDKRLLGRPEFKAMFLDDLLNGSRRQVSAPLFDLLMFSRDWGFRLEDVRVPVMWWHGADDHIIPLAHGQHCVLRLPDASLHVMDGESHLGGLGLVEQILAGLTTGGQPARPLRAVRSSARRGTPST